MKKMLAKHFISAQAFAHQIEYLIAKDLNGGKLAVLKRLFLFFLRTFPLEKICNRALFFLIRAFERLKGKFQVIK